MPTLPPRHAHQDEAATHGRPAGWGAIRDPWIWLNLALLAVAAALYVVPGLDSEAAARWNDWYAYIPILLAALGALLAGLRRVSDEAERRFWSLLAVAFGLHLVVRVVFAFGTSAISHGALADILYALFYLATILALHHRPDRAHEAGEARLRRVESLATTAFVALLFVYFIVVPQWTASGEGIFLVPSLLLYATLDALVFLTLVHMLRTTASPHWRGPLRILAFGAGVWLLLDSYEVSVYLGLLPWIGSESPWNAVWYVPTVAFAVAARLRRHERARDVGFFQTDPGDEMGEYRYIGTILVYAMTLPGIHLLVRATGVLEGVVGPGHDMVALAGLVLMVSLALVHQGLQVGLTRRLRQTSRTLRDQRRLLAAAVEQAEDAVVVSDREGRAVYANEAWLRTVAHLEDFGNRLVPDLLESLAPEAARTWEIASTLRAATRTVTREREGAARQEVVTVTSVTDPGGAVTHLMVVIRDVTRQAALEEQLRKVQRMESLGTMAGGIAHDFNNMLTGILGHAELLLQDLPEDDPGREDLDAIVRASLRARALTGQILTFSRRDTGVSDLVDLPALIHDTLALMRPSIPHGVRVHVEAEPIGGGVWVQESRLHQVVLNLLTNALLAVGPEGELHVTVTEKAVEHGDIPAGVVGGLWPGRYALLVVADDGMGMRQEVVERIFDPFFTTREVGEGTGLGLSVVHGIVADVGGEIEVKSAPGEGTTFRIHLPLRSEAPSSAGSPREEKSGPSRVLVVADDPRVSADARRSLDPSDYRVTSAGGGGLETFLRSPARFDAAVVDHTVAGMAGADVATRLNGYHPRLPIVLLAGDGGGQPRVPPGVVEVIPRPWKPGALGDAVREAVRARGSRA